MTTPIAHGMLLQQPWARLVAEGVFPVLVRSTPTQFHGRVAVVARGYDPLALIDGKPPNRKEFPEPGIIGYVKVVGCLRIPYRQALKELQRGFGKEVARFYPRHYMPNRSPVYFWLLQKPEALRKYRPYNPGKARKWVRLKLSRQTMGEGSEH